MFNVYAIPVEIWHNVLQHLESNDDLALRSSESRSSAALWDSWRLRHQRPRDLFALYASCRLFHAEIEPLFFRHLAFRIAPRWLMRTLTTMYDGYAVHVLSRLAAEPRLRASVVSLRVEPLWDSLDRENTVPKELLDFEETVANLIPTLPHLRSATLSHFEFTPLLCGCLLQAKSTLKTLHLEHPWIPFSPGRRTPKHDSLGPVPTWAGSGPLNLSEVRITSRLMPSLVNN